MKTKFLNAVIAGVALLGASFTANAGLISGTHTTDDGKVVALQNLEWMSLDYTAGLSRNDVEDGFTDNYGTTWAAGEWTYATRVQTESLIGSLWGGNYSGYSADNGDGAAWFLNNFAGLAFDTWAGHTRSLYKHTDTYYTNLDYSRFMFGNQLECSTASHQTCIGGIIVADNVADNMSAVDVASGNEVLSAYVANSGLIGYIHEVDGANFGLTDENDHHSKSSRGMMNYGSLLVRSTNVPEPATVTILSLGLLGLGLRRKKRV